MLSILAQGTLTADPVERTTATGKAFATALLRVPCEDGEPMLVSVISFASDAVQALLALGKGDSLAVAGRGRLTSWERDDVQRHGLSVVADKVLTVYQIDKKRRQATRDAERLPA